MLDRCERCGRVYSDRAAGPADAAGERCPVCGLPLPRTVEERLALLEQVVAGLRRPDPPQGRAATGLLTFGQIASVVMCVATLAAAIWNISLQATIRERVPGFPDRTWEILAAAACAFGYSAAMFVVFTRVKRLPAA